MRKFLKILLLFTAIQCVIALLVGVIAYYFEQYQSALELAIVSLLTYLTYNSLDDIVKFVNSNENKDL